MGFEEECPPTENQIFCCNRMAAEFNQRTTDDQVLLNL